jgi:hypothetical protein
MSGNSLKLCRFARAWVDGNDAFATVIIEVTSRSEIQRSQKDVHTSSLTKVHEAAFATPFLCQVDYCGHRREVPTG